jgi:uncharacterized membrane protein YccC
MSDNARQAIKYAAETVLAIVFAAASMYCLENDHVGWALAYFLLVVLTLLG